MTLPTLWCIQFWLLSTLNTCVQICRPGSSPQSSGMPISTTPLYALTPPLRPLGLWMAWREICQWNSVAPDSILPATHLSVFVPPPLGAFVLANHQNHEGFKSTPASATHSSPIFSVQQNIQFPLPQVFSNQDELLSLARLSASECHLSEEVIPFLGHSNQQMTFKKVRWALRFPLLPPVQRSRCPPLLLHSRLSTGSSQRRSPRRRYQGCRPTILCSRRYSPFAAVALSQAPQF